MEQLIGGWDNITDGKVHYTAGQVDKFVLFEFVKQ